MLSRQGSQTVHPAGHLVIDTNGTIFGTAAGGTIGTCGVGPFGFVIPGGCGVVFSLKGGKFSVLHAFTNDNQDGTFPVS